MTWLLVAFLLGVGFGWSMCAIGWDLRVGALLGDMGERQFKAVVRGVLKEVERREGKRAP